MTKQKQTTQPKSKVKLPIVLMVFAFIALLAWVFVQFTALHTTGVVDYTYEATDGACFAVIIIADEPHLVSISTELFLSIEKGDVIAVACDDVGNCHVND